MPQIYSVKSKSQKLIYVSIYVMQCKTFPQSEEEETLWFLTLEHSVVYKHKKNCTSENNEQFEPKYLILQKVLLGQIMLIEHVLAH